MVDINKFTMNCGGKSYVINKFVDNAKAEEHFQNRVHSDVVDQLVRGAQQQTEQLASQRLQQQQTSTLLPQPIQQLVNGVVRFAAQTAQLTQNVAQQLQQLPATLANVGQQLSRGVGVTFQQVANAILGTFFGFKKDNDKVEERDQREDNDFQESDLFSTQKVGASEQGGMGQGR